MFTHDNAQRGAPDAISPAQLAAASAQSAGAAAGQVPGSGASSPTGPADPSGGGGGGGGSSSGGTGTLAAQRSIKALHAIVKEISGRRTEEDKAVFIVTTGQLLHPNRVAIALRPEAATAARTWKGPFNSVLVVANSISSAHLHPQQGVRVDKLTKSRKIHTPKNIPALCRDDVPASGRRR